MAGGRLKLDLLQPAPWCPPSSCRTRPFGGLDAAHGVTVYWYGKNKAASLFGTPPGVRLERPCMLAWFYYGGGKELFEELRSRS